MATLLFLAAFFGLLSCGMPIFLVLGILAAGLFFLSGQPLVGVAQVVVDHLNSQSLMSLPLFVMAAGPALAQAPGCTVHQPRDTGRPPSIWPSASSSTSRVSLHAV